MLTDGASKPTSHQRAGFFDVVSEFRMRINVPDAWLITRKLLSVLVAFEHYKELRKQRRVLLFVDNNAKRDAVAKGTSESVSVQVMLSELHRIWSQIQCLCWVSRVPTLSNVADLPSRGEPNRLLILFKVQLDSCLNLIPSLCDATSRIQMMMQLKRSERQSCANVRSLDHCPNFKIEWKVVYGHFKESRLMCIKPLTSKDDQTIKRLRKRDAIFDVRVKL